MFNNNQLSLIKLHKFFHNYLLQEYRQSLQLSHYTLLNKVQANKNRI